MFEILKRTIKIKFSSGFYVIYYFYFSGHSSLHGYRGQVRVSSNVAESSRSPGGQLTPVYFGFAKRNDHRILHD